MATRITQEPGAVLTWRYPIRQPDVNPTSTRSIAALPTPASMAWVLLYAACWVIRLYVYVSHRSVHQHDSGGGLNMNQLAG